MLFPFRYIVFFLLPIQLLSAAEVSCYAPKAPANRTRLISDCKYIIGKIPAVEYRPERQQVNSRLTLTIPKNAYRFMVPGRFVHGSCEIKVMVIGQGNLWDYVPVPINELQLKLWGIAKEGLKEIISSCIIRNGLIGVSEHPLPEGRATVVKIKPVELHTYLNL